MYVRNIEGEEGGRVLDECANRTLSLAAPTFSLRTPVRTTAAYRA